MSRTPWFKRHAVSIGGGSVFILLRRSKYLRRKYLLPWQG